MGSTKTSRTCRLRGPRRPRQATTRPSKFTRRAKTPGCRRRPAPWTSSGRACTSTPRATKRQRSPFSRCMKYEKLTKHASAHKGAVAAMQGTDNAQKLGIDYATDKNAKTWPFRDQVAKKNIKYQVVMVYALHELEIAVDEYIKNGVTDVAQRYLDVWWAFYVGSQEYGSGDG